MVTVIEKIFLNIIHLFSVLVNKNININSDSNNYKNTSVFQLQLKLILEFEELFDEYVLLVVVGLPITSIPLWDGKPLIGLVSFNIIIFLNIYCVS